MEDGTRESACRQRPKVSGLGGVPSFQLELLPGASSGSPRGRHRDCLTYAPERVSEKTPSLPRLCRLPFIHTEAASEAVQAEEGLKLH